MSVEQKPNAGQVAVVTGASRGIGRAIAVALAQQGWRIVLNYRSNDEAAGEALRLVQQTSPESMSVKANIAEAVDRARLLATTLMSLGRIDLLVNNAGMAPRQRVDMLQMTEASYDEVMGVNLKGPWFLTQAVARIMTAQPALHDHPRPKIVNIGSMSAYTSSVNRAEYCLSKAGMGMMTKLFADRLAEYGINVYEVRPGIIETDMTSPVHDKYDKGFATGLTPIARWGQPEEVARAVVAIAADYLPYSTGEVINVDGGIHLQRL
ncbi:MAG TPA: 3-ketoacyl-ACP reductase [Anaerolineae bacterium]|jgi:NAD(P)-dependent dehydrogenase (short-subunit alcohol dehydrogenase family)